VGYPNLAFSILSWSNSFFILFQMCVLAVPCILYVRKYRNTTGYLLRTGIIIAITAFLAQRLVLLLNMSSPPRGMVCFSSGFSTV